MEDRFRTQVVGQELNKDDVALLAAEAALADDRVLSELLRPSPLGATPTRGILPPSHSLTSGTTSTALVIPSGSADAKVNVGPFRAFVGPSSPTTGVDKLRDNRSGIAVGATNIYQPLQFAAQSTNPRWDLIYAVVDVEIDGAFVNRYVKTGSTAAGVQSISTTTRTRVQLATVQGTPAATPARPALPADSGSTYYIPLAYVLLPAGHTLTTAIAPTNIQECAPVLSISRAMGVSTLAPATGMSSASGIAVANEGWTPATGRPKAFLPSSMVGIDSVLIALKESATPRTVALSGTGVIDNSRDWRRRLFWVTAFAATSDFCWNSAASNPSYLTAPVVGMSNSFDATSYAGTDSMVFSFTHTNFAAVAAGATVSVYVDHSTGALMCAVGATDPACNFLLRVEASAQFNDAF